MMRTYCVCISFLFVFTALIKKTLAQAPLFPNSVVSNDIDFILGTDPDAFVSLSFVGLDDKEMPDSQTDILFDEDTFVFAATFTDGQVVEIWCHSSFVTQEAAQEYAEKLCPRLGKLPDVHRDPISHVVIHNGNAGAFAEIEGNFFVLYSENMDARISTNDLEETVFHEAVHASIQEVYEDDPLWTNAQEADGVFVTEYAEELPSLEDMPETALFAYTYIVTPGRLSPEIESWLAVNLPNRLAFFEIIYGSLVGVNTLAEKPVLMAYPNPAEDVFNVVLSGVKKNQQITIYSITGGAVKSTLAADGLNSLDISELPAGVYYLETRGYEILRLVKE